jgi:hypothetical protein
MNNRLLGIYHLQAVMGTKLRTYAAMSADDWLFRLFVKVYGAHNADRHAFPAADACFLIYENSAAGPLFQGVARADADARRFPAPEADNGDIAALNAAGCAYLDCAFAQGMVLLVSSRTDIHTRETTEAFVHFFWH